MSYHTQTTCSACFALPRFIVTIESPGVDLCAECLPRFLAGVGTRFTLDGRKGETMKIEVICTNAPWRPGESKGGLR